MRSIAAAIHRLNSPSASSSQLLQSEHAQQIDPTEIIDMRKVYSCFHFPIYGIQFGAAAASTWAGAIDAGLLLPEPLLRSPIFSLFTPVMTSLLSCPPAAVQPHLWTRWAAQMGHVTSAWCSDSPAAAGDSEEEPDRKNCCRWGEGAVLSRPSDTRCPPRVVK